MVLLANQKPRIFRVWLTSRSISRCGNQPMFSKIQPKMIIFSHNRRKSQVFKHLKVGYIYLVRTREMISSKVAKKLRPPTSVSDSRQADYLSFVPLSFFKFKKSRSQGKIPILNARDHSKKAGILRIFHLNAWAIKIFEPKIPSRDFGTGISHLGATSV